MPSTPDRSTAAYPSPSSGRRLFNRISSPFGNKARNIPEFEIKADDPHKQYNPGDIVSGSVRLRLNKPTRVTHIVARLHGYVQVYKNPGSPGDAYRANPAYLTTHRGSKSGEYFGNGFASLFEDEVVLCGDGRLAEGAYQFNFELEFPDRDLPSSIEFERGTICYMITATMTRPTAMSPVLTCESKVYFMERIDIAPLYPPRPSTIILEPVTRRLRAKTQARKIADRPDKRNRKSDTGQQGSDPHRNSEASSVPTSGVESESPTSPGPSELSFHSGDGGSQGTISQYEVRSQMSPSIAPTSKLANNSKISLPSKVITVVVETQAGGCLRGDTIPVKININHTKQVKSFHGVIVTLYRVARVDMRPSIPLGPTEKGKDAKYEEYYPKSMTGLGGLSLSGAGSSHVFRKDLSQTIAPLYIDPQTLTAEIATKVRVPEEAFPTISTVPGQMISFKYFVEVVLDVQGRLAGQDRTFSSLPGQAGNNLSMEPSDMERSAFNPFGSTIVDTASVRRDKGVVSCSFEVIIGTKDSERKKGKRKAVEAVDTPEIHPVEQQQVEPQLERQPQAQPDEQEYDWYDTAAYHDPRYYEYQYWYYQQHGHFMPDYPPPDGQQQAYDVPPPLPVPQLQDESQMTEKERIRQAETRLLPSQPPGVDMEESDAAYASSAPTAPYFPEENEGVSVPPAWHAGSSSQPSASASVRPNGVLLSAEQRENRFPTAPAYEPPAGSSSAHASAAATDDKQELRRQELQAAASAPPMDDMEDEAGPSTAPELAPSAPTFAQAEGEETVHDSHADALGESSLPRYER